MRAFVACLVASLLPWMAGCHLMHMRPKPKKAPEEFSCGEKCPPAIPSHPR